MIKITVDTKEELDIIRRVLRDEACSHNPCNNDNSCKDCINGYFENKVILYKNEVVALRENLIV